MPYGRCDVERTNQPLTNEAARKLMAMDVQDKEILTYEKLDERKSWALPLWADR